MSMATKLGRLVTQRDEELPPITSHDHLIKWLCEVMWQIKYIIYLLPVDQWSPNVG